jgi:hypothetical protein
MLHLPGGGEQEAAEDLYPLVEHRRDEFLCERRSEGGLL